MRQGQSVSSVPPGELCGGNRKASDPCVSCIPSSLSLETVSLRHVAQGFTCLERRGAERSLHVLLGPGEPFQGDRQLFWVLLLPLQAV